MHMHVCCNHYEIREQDATKKTSPEMSVPRTKDVDFASFFHGWYRSVLIYNVLQEDDFVPFFTFAHQCIEYSQESTRVGSANSFSFPSTFWFYFLRKITLTNMTLLHTDEYQGCHKLNIFVQGKISQEHTHGFHHRLDPLTYFPTFCREEIF